MYPIYAYGTEEQKEKYLPRLGELAGLLFPLHLFYVSRQLVYGHFVYDTSSTDISSTMTFLAAIKAGVMKRIIY